MSKRSSRRMDGSTRAALRSGKSAILALLTLLLTTAPVWSMGGIGLPPAEPTPTLSLTRGPLASPVRLDLGRAGRNRQLLVSDYERQAVVRVDPDNPDSVETLFTLAGKPLGIAQTGRKILVGNSTTGVVELYNRDGRKLREYAATAAMQPNDLAVDARRRLLFVADGLANEVKLFSLRGRLLQTIGGGELVDPKGIAINPRTRTIAVADLGDPAALIDASIRIYDYAGTLQQQIFGLFSAPRGLVLTEDRLFCVDALLGQVLAFDLASGQPLGTAGSFGSAEGSLLFPMDVALDAASQTLYVTNNRLGRVTALDAAALLATEVQP